MNKLQKQKRKTKKKKRKEKEKEKKKKKKEGRVRVSINKLFKGHQKYNFVGDVIKIAQSKKLLDGYKVFATSNTKPRPEEIREIVLSAGGEVK